MTILNMIIPTENLAENNVKIASLNCNGFKSNRHYIERLKKKKRREDYVTTVILGQKHPASHFYEISAVFLPGDDF